MKLLRILFAYIFFTGLLYCSEPQFDLNIGFDEPSFYNALCTLPGHQVLQINFACKTGWRPASSLEKFALKHKLRKEVLRLYYRYKRMDGFDTNRLSRALIRLFYEELSSISKGAHIPYSMQMQVQWQNVEDDKVGEQSVFSQNSDFYLSASIII
jgi:hypothetical protein